MRGGDGCTKKTWGEEGGEENEVGAVSWGDKEEKYDERRGVERVKG